MRALITGFTGFVGSHLADYLLANTDWHIVGMLRWRSPLDNVRHLIPEVDKRISLVYADLKDELSVRTAVQKAAPDYVFHLAAQSFPKTSFTAPLDTIDTNLQGTIRLLEALKESNPIIHVCSSSEVYGRAKTTPIAEDAPFHPASPYAISKIGADLAAQHYAEAYGMRIVVSRMFTHTGPRRGDVFAESSFAKQIAMGEAGLTEPVIRVGNLKSLRTVADVRDAVRAYHMLLSTKPGSVYNIGGSYSATVGDILNAMLVMSKTKFQVIGDPSRLRPVVADLQVPDCSKFKRDTGWEPRIGILQTLGDLLDYWRSRVKREGQFLTR